MSESHVLFACVGGFLGAGKTTALAAVARALTARGRRVALVANDQGQGLVDTAAFRGLGIPAAEVAGGCFCCRFDDLVSEAGRLLAEGPVDVLLAEAVGSCTDLVATVYRPLRRLHPDRFRLAPFTVLVEPSRLAEMSGHGHGVPADVAYIFGRQLAEADVVALNKVDRLATDGRAVARASLERLAGGAPVIEMSAVSGEGIAAWTERLLRDEALSDRELELDYDVYARGEAALAWLNASLELRSARPFPPRAAGEAIVEAIAARARRARLFLPHVKVLVEAPGGSGRVALTRAESQPRWDGESVLQPSGAVSALVNARAVSQPEAFRALVKGAVTEAARVLGASLAVSRVECFSPARPVPRHRFSAHPGS